MQAETRVFSDREELARAAARRWLDIYRESVARHGAFYVALAGGSTPRRLYRILACPDISAAVEWQRVHFFFGDERAVPPDHPESNFGMARETLLEHVPVPEGNVHRMETELRGMDAVASRYESLLTDIVPAGGEGIPQLDLILLGIGPDGHTASLFPGTDILQQTGRYVAPVYVEQKACWRVSVTLPVIEEARHVLFLVAGEEKQPVVKQLLTDPGGAPVYPVQMPHYRGSVELYLDAAAAGPELSTEQALQT